MPSAKFFRWVWRVDAVLILLVAAAALFGVITVLVSEARSSARQRQAAATAPPVVPNAEKKALRLGDLTHIEGTTVFRAELTSQRRGMEFSSSSGYATETRNVLLIDLSDGSARWLLPSDKELVAFEIAVPEPSHVDDASKPPVARVALIKPYSENPDNADGRLLLLDPIAAQIHEVATGVHAVDGAALTPNGHIAVLFESNRTYRLALFDHSSLAKISEREVNVPQLK